MFDPEGGSRLRSALEPFARRVDKHDERTREQRLADALVEQVSANQQTELLVTVPLETLMGVDGAPAAETEWGALLSKYAVERLACSSALRRVVLDSRNVVIEMGRKERLITDRQHRALVARDGGCAVPGCDRPPRYSVGHHLTLWSEGGLTNVEETALACWHHHRHIHDHGWRLVRNQNGTFRMIPPIPPNWSLDPPAA